jgi:peptidoglycan/xylan/chitin deacetylase (PgdA/CDA1 family)
MAARSQSLGERVAATLDRRGARFFARRAPGWRGLLVLNYHRVGEHRGEPWDHALWSASAEALDWQLATLAAEAEVIGPEEVQAASKSRARARRVLITFDDGYRDNFEIAYPSLRRHGLTATFFLATGFIDKPRIGWWDELAWMVRKARAKSLPAGDWLQAGIPLQSQESAIATLVQRYKELAGEQADAFLDYVAAGTESGRCDPAEAREMWMTWEMAREMRRGGMSIGGHTVNHPVLAQLAPERQAEEISQCASRLAEELGEPMSWFAYPVGARGTFTAETQQLLRAQGVELAFSFYGGWARFSQWNPLDVPRTHVGEDLNLALLRARLRMPYLFAR